jgi:transcription termination/antitermination protein NusG
MQWYIVNTFSNYENSVKRALEERISRQSLEEAFGEILVPTEDGIARRGNKQVKIQKKLFPGYVFVQMDIDRLEKIDEEGLPTGVKDWDDRSTRAISLIRNTPRVSGFLGGRDPQVVPQVQMDQMLGASQPKEETEEELPDVSYAVGQQVRITKGPFAKFMGAIQEVNAERRKIKLTVTIFGRPTPVEVDFNEVEAVEDDA